MYTYIHVCNIHVYIFVYILHMCITYVYTCKYTKYTCIHILHVSTCIHVYVQVYMYTYMYICNVYLYVHIYMYTYMYILHVSTCIHVHLYVHMNINIYRYIHITATMLALQGQHRCRELRGRRHHVHSASRHRQLSACGAHWRFCGHG
jgi:hypothetical protein